MAAELKIAFVSNRDPQDVRAWSGTPYFMANALMQAGHNVSLIGPLTLPLAVAFKAVRKGFGLFGKTFDPERCGLVAQSYAKQVESRLRHGDFDLVLSTSTLPLAYLKTDLPKICWVDASFGGMVDFYPGAWSNMSRATHRAGMKLETRAFSNIDVAMFSSDWAAESAMQHHNAKSARIMVNPLGANVEAAPDSQAVLRFVQERANLRCKLLFVGVEWERKGGDLVVETAKVLRARGVDVEVDIVGCLPPIQQPDFVKCHGFISKSSEQGRQRLTDLMARAHFLFVPSVAECFGLVYAEAAAHGLPSIARAVGGVSNVVVDGVSGYLLTKDASPEKYAEIIQEVFQNKSSYDELAVSAKRFYDTSLTWGAAVERFERMFGGRFADVAIAKP